MEKKSCTFIGEEIERLSFGYDYTDPKCIALKLALSEQIAEAYGSGVRRFYSVCEQGIDLWAAEAVLLLMEKHSDAELCCLLPYEEQASRWHPETQESYYSVLRRATSVVFWGTHYTEGCLGQVRESVIDSSDCVIAAAADGNRYVDYALGLKKPVSGVQATAGYYAEKYVSQCSGA